MQSDDHLTVATKSATSEPDLRSRQTGNLSCGDGVAPEVLQRILVNEAKIVREQKREFQKN